MHGWRIDILVTFYFDTDNDGNIIEGLYGTSVVVERPFMFTVTLDDTEIADNWFKYKYVDGEFVIKTEFED